MKPKKSNCLILKFCISFTLLFISQNVQSQFIIAGVTGTNDIYTDIIDTTFEHTIIVGDTYSQNYYLDIDNDGTDDFNIIVHEQWWQGSAAAFHDDKEAYIKPLHSNASVATIDTTYRCIACPSFLRKLVPKLFNIGDTIFNSYFNTDYSSPYLVNEPNAYFWNDTWSENYHSQMGNNYVGVKLQYSDTTILSWIRIDIQFQTITLLDYSYSNINIIGVNENHLKNLIVFPNPVSESISIRLGRIENDVKVTLLNSLGHMVYNNKYNYINLITIEIDIPSGLYFLKIEYPESEFKILKIIKK